MNNVGYIGLGIMGKPMAMNLLNGGYSVAVWNRTPSKAIEIVNEGAIFSASAKDVARQSDVVCVNVTNTKDVEEVVFGEKGIVAGGREGLIIIDHSTISPKATREFAERVKAKGMHWLDAPVSGGDVGARAATLSIMVGGEEVIFDKCLEIFKTVGARVTLVGPNGSGQACKACNQILCAVNLMGVCEAMGLAVKEGVDLEKMLTVTSAGAGGSWSLSNLGQQIANGDMAPGFMIDYLLKDLGIVGDAIEEAGVNFEAVALAEKMFQACSDAGDGKAGTQALSEHYAKNNDLKYSG